MALLEVVSVYVYYFLSTIILSEFFPAYEDYAISEDLNMKPDPYLRWALKSEYTA